MDRTFQIPKANIYLNFYSILMRTNPTNSLCIHIFYNYINNLFESAFSDAKDAGNEVKITCDEKYL